MFACLRCGNCCKAPESIPLVFEDFERLVTAKRFDVIARARPYINKFSGEQGFHFRRPCPFLVRVTAKTYECSIYELRPLICRLFPEHGNIILKSECPGFRFDLDKELSKGLPEEFYKEKLLAALNYDWIRRLIRNSKRIP